MSDRVFYQRKCDNRVFYRGTPKPDGMLPSYLCARGISAQSMPELELKAQNYGWKKLGEGAERRDICEKCFKRAKEQGL